MEHTHLVKGLDYSLLQKVRSEIVFKEKEEEELESVYHSQISEKDVEKQIKHPLARNLHKLMFGEPEIEFKPNELFAPRRMAYVIELEDEADEVPTTLVRSKHDCPTDETSTNLSTNDMVIQKLTQVLAYLRTDLKRRKKEKGGTTGTGGAAEQKSDEKRESGGQNIYDNIGEYKPDLKRKSTSRRGPDENTQDKRSYFRSSEKEVEEKRVKRDSPEREKRRFSDKRSERPKDQTREKLDITSKYRKEMPETKAEKNLGSDARDPLYVGDEGIFGKSGVKMTTKAPVDSYMECYPGGYGTMSGDEGSDDEVDVDKIDMGAKKGQIRRWDFDTSEEYEKYMSKKEALPKAAFQFGVKLNSGRKNKTKLTSQSAEKNDKQKIDRQWNQISKILAKRKGDAPAETE